MNCLLILVCANRVFSLRAIGYHVERISRIKILERVSLSNCLVLHSIEKESFSNPDVDKKSLFNKGSLRKTP